MGSNCKLRKVKEYDHKKQINDVGKLQFRKRKRVNDKNQVNDVSEEVFCAVRVIQSCSSVLN